MRTRPAVPTALAALALLTLGACSAPAGVPGAGAGSEGGLAGCLQGSWRLDIENNARQLQEFFVANGTPVTSTEASGGVALTVDGDSMSYRSDASYVMVAALDGGLEMVISQLQAGESSGTWSVEDDQVVFADWANGITIVSDVTIGGQSASMPIEIPADAGSGVAMEVSCDGDLLETHPAESPFTSVWTRA